MHRAHSGLRTRGLGFLVEPSASAMTPAPINFTTTIQPINVPSPCAGFPEVIEGTSVASGVINDTFTVSDCAHFGHNTLHAQCTLQSDMDDRNDD